MRIDDSFAKDIILWRLQDKAWVPKTSSLLADVQCFFGFSIEMEDVFFILSRILLEESCKKVRRNIFCLLQQEKSGLLIYKACEISKEACSV